MTIAKATLRRQITDAIVDGINSTGTLPWDKPWNSMAGFSNLPCNHVTGRQYNGINVLLLWSAANANGYSTNRWMTYKQASELGIKPPKGGTMIVFNTQIVTPEEQQAAEAEDRDPKKIWIIKPYWVWNIDQLGVSAPEAKPLPAAETNRRAESIIANSNADFRAELGSDEAYYNRQGDFIVVPTIAQYDNPEDYYRVAMHELVHWTGAEHRLNRVKGRRFGDKDYAFEELVAEMGSAFSCGGIGLEYSTRHTAYIKSWVSVLKNDEKAIFRAAALASKASDMLLAFEDDEPEEVVDLSGWTSVYDNASSVDLSGWTSVYA